MNVEKDGLSDILERATGEVAELLGVDEEVAQKVCLLALARQLQPDEHMRDGLTLVVNGSTRVYGSLLEASVVEDTGELSDEITELILSVTNRQEAH